MKIFAYVLIFMLAASNAFAQGSRRIQSSDVTGALGYTPLQSIGAMTGPAITCGSGVTCAGNTISASGGGGTPGGASGQIQYNNSGSFAGFTLSGDATLNAGTGILSLSTVNSNVGSFGSSTQCTAVTTNAKGLITAASAVTCTPAIASITGLGTGVSPALAINVGTIGSLVVNGGALGTPASGTLTFATGLVASTGISATGTPSATTYLRGDNTWASVAGSGTVTTTGAPASGNIAAFSGATSITNSNLSGDITTSGTLATTYANVVPAAKGGAGTITGALKANGSGVVSQAACADLSNATAACSQTTVTPTSWTPNDQSGAGLAFTGVSANYVRMGNMVFAYGTFTFPGTANGSNAAFGGLPVTVANADYAEQCHISWSNVPTLIRLKAIKNSTTFIPYTASGVGITNASFSGLTLTFMCIYPAT